MKKQKAKKRRANPKRIPKAKKKGKILTTEERKEVQEMFRESLTFD
ncbi:MAG: hypothetical protein ACE5KA_02080 [Nitrososphaerales archaeon]